MPLIEETKPAPPAHACAYCNVSEESSVVKCDVCNKWFCNGTANTAGSHIINHLVKSRHKAVALHESSPLGDSVLECFSCGSRNVFLLGFVPCKQDSVVMLLCREPCLASNNIGSLKDDPNWDLSLWQALIEERSFVPWLVKAPDTGEEDHYNPLTNREIQQLEELWRQKPSITAQEMLTTGGDKLVESNPDFESVDPVPTHFENGGQYRAIMSPLVNLEAQSELRLRESQASSNVAVRWDLSVSKRRVGFFMFTREEHEAKLAVGDELKISIDNFDPKSGNVLMMSTSETTTWEAVGYVVRVMASEEVCVELKPQFSSAKGPWNHAKPHYRVSFVIKSVTYDRQQEALKTFATDETSVSSVIYHLLLGKHLETYLSAQLKVKLPTSFAVPNLPPLNHSQQYAVKKALAMPLSIILGPPGSGKTLTSSTLLYHLARQPNAGQILVCAPSNTACDHLTEKLHLTGLKVVRVTAKSREDVVSPVDFLTLHAQIKQLAESQDEGKSDFLKLSKLKDTIGELSVGDERRYRQAKSRLERRILDNADIVCCTCVSAADPRISSLRFKHVLVDEATQATEPECLIPLVMGAKQVILVGDHCQLGPVILSKAAARAGFKQSLFERIIAMGIRPIRLEVQYRMHPALAEFPSQTFYEGSLQNGVTVADRRVDNFDFPWPRRDMPMFFYHSGGNEEISGSGTSYLNRAEAMNVERIVTHFIKSGLLGSQIGVITPYEGQRAHIQSVLQRHTTLHTNMYKDVEIASVDAFQGREKDFIILSCVRSNSQAGLGFLQDPRRLNVAITRAKYGLVICGNAYVIGKAPSRGGVPSVWTGLISHLYKHNLIVEGPLGNLRQVHLNLPNISRGREAPQVLVETNENLEAPVRAPSSYFDDMRQSRSSRRRAHSGDSELSAR
jgi:regulator of nonsense transcripts 1